MQLVSNVLLGLHAYTGCNTFSTFSGKHKGKPLKLMIKHEKYISNLASIGEKVEISASSFHALVEVGYKLYGVIRGISLVIVVTSIRH